MTLSVIELSEPFRQIPLSLGTSQPDSITV